MYVPTENVESLETALMGKNSNYMTVAILSAKELKLCLRISKPDQCGVIGGLEKGWDTKKEKKINIKVKEGIKMGRSH